MNKLHLFSFNWLVYKINNSSFDAFFDVIKGRVIDLGCGTSPYKEDILKVTDEYIGELGVKFWTKRRAKT